MTVLRSLISTIFEGMTPDREILLMRFRTRRDSFVTLLLTLLAIVLAIGYQVIGRWARRAGWVD